MRLDTSWRSTISYFIFSTSSIDAASATFRNKDGDEEEVAGCKDAPYYSTSTSPKVQENFGVWYADWFEPAKYINRAAPLILIRGNHETCSRAGAGYFRYLHHGNDTECADPYANSPYGAATKPWVVDFEQFQVGVTDTSTPPNESENTTQAFADQLNLLGHYFEGNKKPAVFGARECSCYVSKLTHVDIRENCLTNQSIRLSVLWLGHYGR